MKDYLHLFGGMGAAIVALAIYIFAFGAAMRCFAEERVTYPASDGVNQVTARVRDDGVVIPESVTLAYVEPPPREKVTVYRLELHSEKAARKDEKNLAKLRKDLEKYRDKAETEAFAELCGLLLELLPEGE